MEVIFELGLYVIGFLIYMFFCITTFKVYSKKKEMTKVFILFFIYVYYSILANYVISFVLLDSFLIKKIVISLAYILFGAFFLKNYYEEHIKNEDKNLYGQNV